MKTSEIMSELRSAIKQERKALLWSEWDSAPDMKCSTQFDFWGMKAPIGGCGCVRKPRGKVVMCAVKQWRLEWKEGYFRVYAEFNPHELLELMTTPCQHGHCIWNGL